MAKRYHVSNETGKHGVCTAKEGNCPVNRAEGDTTSPDTPHYATVKDAQVGFEQRNKDLEVQSVSKKPEKSKEVLALEKRESELGDELAERDLQKALLARKHFASLNTDDYDDSQAAAIVDDFVRDVKELEHNYADAQKDFDEIRVKIENQEIYDASPKLTPKRQALTDKKSQIQNSIKTLNEDKKEIKEAWDNSSNPNAVENCAASIKPINEDLVTLAAELEKTNTLLVEDRFDSNMNDDDVAWHANRKAQIGMLTKQKVIGVDEEHYIYDSGNLMNPSRFEYPTDNEEISPEYPAKKGESSVVILAKEDGSEPVAASFTGEFFTKASGELGKSAYIYSDENRTDKDGHGEVQEGFFVVGYVNKNGLRSGYVPDEEIPLHYYT